MPLERHGCWEMVIQMTKTKKIVLFIVEGITDEMYLSEELVIRFIFSPAT